MKAQRAGTWIAGGIVRAVSGAGALGYTYLEKRFKMRPAGVVSKKLIGDLKMANAILSCSFREACGTREGGR